MISLKDLTKKNKTAESAWAHFGPYYAMFPLSFAFNVVNKYSKEGDIVLDPFAGRYTSIYAGAVLNRKGIGVEINPVGWLFGNAKLHPAEKEDVVLRLAEIYRRRNYFKKKAREMPEFYHMCFCDEVLKFLLSARKNLDWQNNQIDATLMAFLLVYLHGKKGQSLSNQMRITKSMGMDYSIGWWKKNGMEEPPQINPFDYMLGRINWRYKNGIPCVGASSVILGDSTIELDNVSNMIKENNEKVSLLFTSPPYCAITDYYADQWLRLWLLGGSERLVYSKEKYKGRFDKRDDYYELLDNVFSKCSKLMSDDAIVFVRTDARKFTLEATLEVLKKNFPDYSVSKRLSKLKKGSMSQTALYGNKSSKPAEVDIIMKRIKIQD
ncbi:MAG: site-specific DNA-methyltransferase [Bacteroidales bacterium]|nr:site-specific DNA-methyltransferase [Bacteroidales bacterium]